VCIRRIGARNLKIGIIGDIHGNLEALEAVLEALAAERVEQIACVGDIVGYGADPAACIAVVRERAGAVVAGNHDWGVVGKQAIDYFNAAAREALAWTSQQLSEEDRWWLSNLPLTVRAEAYELVHASFHNPGQFPYIFNLEDAGPSFARQRQDVAFFGHTHWPSTFLGGEPVQHSIQKVVPLDSPGKVLVNVGSVGQPRDSDPAASCVVFDTNRRRISFRRVAYDVEKAAGKIVKAGLPASLAERLFVGY